MFRIPQLIEHVSSIMTLEEGDLLLTGPSTPFHSSALLSLMLWTIDRRHPGRSRTRESWRPDHRRARTGRQEAAGFGRRGAGSSRRLPILGLLITSKAVRETCSVGEERADHGPHAPSSEPSCIAQGIACRESRSKFGQMSRRRRVSSRILLSLMALTGRGCSICLHKFARGPQPLPKRPGVWPSQRDHKAATPNTFRNPSEVSRPSRTRAASSACRQSASDFTSFVVRYKGLDVCPSPACNSLCRRSR